MSNQFDCRNGSHHSIPKTIQQLLVIVAAIGLVFAIVKWNWGLAIFLASLLPLAYGVYRWRRSSGLARLLATAWILVGAGLVYGTSPGPYVGSTVILHRLTGAGQSMNSWFGFLYRPHIELCTGRFGSEPFNTVFTDYIVQWQVLCGL
ncbi:hypothetical protein FYK55_08130 [Roseiconus nitratireducens]|uniref:Uncharacterized protein n=1 Tax=Roseiconus nitratireducens TaxID=2605748 RepID=A0A5M6D9R2_9BACT|nr:hypothetical protein [Roseiconus nitratireducens]KAA5544308.1 hypothetical protein FYK55_08130 [Roseiconus nitratireducens]